MISILKLILKPVEKLRDWIIPKYYDMVLNPYVSDRFLLKNKNKLKTKMFLYKDPKLMDKYPEFVDWNYIGNSAYNDDDFADLWIKHLDKIRSHKIIVNKNPKIAKLIKSMAKLTKYSTDSWYLSTNSNPGLTEYLTKHWKLLPKTKFTNMNPKLFNLMMNDPNPCWISLSGREEPEFADFLIKNEENLNLDEIAKNSNPGLTDFIIKISHKLNMKQLTKNKNPGLSELKKSNKDKLDWNYISCGKDKLLLDNLGLADWAALSRNENQEVVETIVNNPDKVDYNGLSFNRNKKLIKFKEIHRSKLTHRALCSNSNILEIDNSFYIKFMQ